MMNTSTARFSGSNQCPCIDVSGILATFQNCKSLSGIPGIRTEKSTTCYPLNYGSNYCGTHDDFVHPFCMGASPPEFCGQSFCYVDAEKCQLSEELFFPSDLFFETEPQLYYSYSTCNSSEVSWLKTTTTEELQHNERLAAVIPLIQYPHNYKLTANGTISENFGPKYYNNSIPYHGALIDYMQKVVDYSKDIAEITYKFCSRGSSAKYPLSAFTASVRDVQYGLADLAIGPFWVTAERLRMVAFTTTVTMDKTFLVIKTPSIDNSLAFEIQKVLYPFEYSLWGLLVGTIFVVGALSIWFASPRASNKAPWLAFRSDDWRRSSLLRKCYICYRQVLDAALQRGVDFFVASVDFDYQATMSYKILMFGFSFLILITVAAYTANLAAFLTQSRVSPYIDSMPAAIKQDVKICAHPVLRDELLKNWPGAQFVFNDQTGDYDGIIESYDAGNCDVMAFGWLDTRYDKRLMNMLCERELVFTKGLVIEVPVAFPVKQDLAAGISYWILEAERNLAFSYDSIYESYKPDLECPVEVGDLNDTTDNEKLTIHSMAFPFLVLALCIVIAVIKKICDRRNTIRAAQMIAKIANLDQASSEMIVDIAKFAHLDIHDVAKYENTLKRSNCTDDDEENDNVHDISKSDCRVLDNSDWVPHHGKDGTIFNNDVEARRRIRESISGALRPHLDPDERMNSLKQSFRQSFRQSNNIQLYNGSPAQISYGLNSTAPDKSHNNFIAQEVPITRKELKDMIESAVKVSVNEAMEKSQCISDDSFHSSL